MGLLTVKEAARVLSEGLGRPIKPRNVQDAARRGRLQAERGPGRGGPYLIPEEEVLQVLEDAYRTAHLAKGDTWT